MPFDDPYSKLDAELALARRRISELDAELARVRALAQSGSQAVECADSAAERDARTIRRTTETAQRNWDGWIAETRRARQLAEQNAELRALLVEALVRKLQWQGLTAERVAAVAAASPRVGRALVGVLRARLDVIEQAPESAPGAALPCLTAELGDVARVWLDADADGVHERDELVRLDRELAELEEATRAVRRWVAGRMGA